MYIFCIRGRDLLSAFGRIVLVEDIARRLMGNLWTPSLSDLDLVLFVEACLYVQYVVVYVVVELNAVIRK